MVSSTVLSSGWLYRSYGNLLCQTNAQNVSINDSQANCHTIWQLYKKLEGVFESIEFQN